MLFSNAHRCLYERPTAHEVICQLRFPTILSIDSREPADFQEEIRAQFPLYGQRREAGPVKVTQGRNGAPELQNSPPVMNYTFVSEDNLWKLNLTKNFIALSTLHYTGWEDFAAKLDMALAAFIRIYQPAFFERIGLRYRNIVSRSRLGLEDCSWQELISRPYLGPLGEADVSAAMIKHAALDFDLALSDNCFAKVHAEPTHMKAPGTKEPEAEEKFMLDVDLSMRGNTAAQLAAGALETLHAHSTRVFRGAITETLHEAMGPL